MKNICEFFKKLIGSKKQPMSAEVKEVPPATFTDDDNGLPSLENLNYFVAKEGYYIRTFKVFENFQVLSYCKVSNVGKACEIPGKENYSYYGPGIEIYLEGNHEITHIEITTKLGVTVFKYESSEICLTKHKLLQNFDKNFELLMAAVYSNIVNGNPITIEHINNICNMKE